MQRKLWLIVLIGLLSAWLYQAPATIACSCMPPDQVNRELQKATAVFEGRVTDISQSFPILNTGNDTTRIAFEVENVWKGPGYQTLTAHSSPNSASCGYVFTVGESYLVYAHGDQQLNVSLCSPTKPLADAQSDIVELNSIVTPISDLAEQPIINTNSIVLLAIGGIVVLLALGLAAFVAWQRRQPSA